MNGDREPRAGDEEHAEDLLAPDQPKRASRLRKIGTGIGGVLVAIVLGGIFVANSLRGSSASAADLNACEQHFQVVLAPSPEGMGASFRRMLEADDKELRRLGAEGRDALFASLRLPSDEVNDDGAGVPPEIAAIFDVQNRIGKRCQAISHDYRNKLDAWCRKSGTCAGAGSSPSQDRPNTDPKRFLALFLERGTLEQAGEQMVSASQQFDEIFEGTVEESGAKADAAKQAFQRMGTPEPLDYDDDLAREEPLLRQAYAAIAIARTATLSFLNHFKQALVRYPNLSEGEINTLERLSAEAAKKQAAAVDAINKALRAVERLMCEVELYLERIIKRRADPFCDRPPVEGASS